MEYSNTKFMAFAEKKASEAMGNWRKFDSFAWFDKPEDAESWTIVYTHTRDSGLLDQSNASVIDEKMTEFEVHDEPDQNDVRKENHSHWACGWVEGWAIRVRNRQGKLTGAWLAYCKFMKRLEDYPVLDENDYSDREHEATLANIETELEDIGADAERSADVFTWFHENNQEAIENVDDQGGFPSRDDIVDACKALGIEYESEESEDE